MKNFHHVLNSHNKLYTRRLQIAKEIVTDAKSISDPKARSHQLKEAEKLLSFIKNAYQDFEAKHSEELEALRSLSLRE